MKKTLTVSDSSKKNLIGALIAFYVIQLIATVSYAAQYSFFRNSSPALSIDLYSVLFFAPVIFIPTMIVQRAVKPLIDQLFLASLWTVSVIFIAKIIQFSLSYFPQPTNVDAGVWVLGFPVIASIVIYIIGLTFYRKFFHKKNVNVEFEKLHKPLIVLSLAYITIYATRPLQAIFRFLSFEGSLPKNHLFNMMFLQPPVMYYNWTPFIFTILLVSTGYFLTKTHTIYSGRWFVVLFGTALTLLIANTWQSFGNFFVTLAYDNIFYVLVHISSYVISLGFFVYFIKQSRTK